MGRGVRVGGGGRIEYVGCRMEKVEAGKGRRVNEVSITDIPRQKIDRPQTEILAIWSCATSVVCLLFLFLSAWFLYRFCMVSLQNLHGFTTESA